jgi:hypothetical protein
MWRKEGMFYLWRFRSPNDKFPKAVFGFLVFHFLSNSIRKQTRQRYERRVVLPGQLGNRKLTHYADFRPVCRA